MKTNFFALLAILFLISCKKEIYKSKTDWQKISEKVQYKEDGGLFLLNSGKFGYQFEHKKLPLKKVVLLNASLVGYFGELGIENRIVGVSSPEYIYSDKLLGMIADGTIQNVGNEQKYMVEKIIALKPDAVLTNYVASFENTYGLLQRNGIEVVFLDEYLEQNPLEKTAYLKVFGKLFGKEKESVERFNQIKSSYDSMRAVAQKAEKKPMVVSNEMYGGQWFMPGGKTQLANFIKDAGAHYILKDNTEEKAVPLSFEEVFVKADKAEFWVNAGNHQGRKSMLAINPNYERLKVFKNGKIYAVTGREKNKANDFFESGVVRSDLVLRDYIKIFHPEIFSTDSLVYLKELK